MPQVEKKTNADNRKQSNPHPRKSAGERWRDKFSPSLSANSHQWIPALVQAVLEALTEETKRTNVEWKP